MPEFLRRYFLGCTIGAVLSMMWSGGLSFCCIWDRWLEGEQLRFFRLILYTLRYPLFIECSRYSRFGRRLIVPALIAYGVSLSYTISCLILRNGAWGLLMALQMLLSRFVLLPVLFALSIRCRARSGSERPNFWRLTVLILFCTLVAAADRILTPLILTFLLWMQ